MQRGLQFTDADGLGDVIVHAGLQTFFAIAHQRVAGHGDDARALVGGPALADLPRRFQAVHLRHLHVEEQDVVGLLFQRFEDFDAVVGDVGAIAELVQHAEADFLVDGVVVGQQQPQGQAAGEVGIERRRDGRFLLALKVDAQARHRASSNCAGRMGLWTEMETPAGGGARVIAARAHRGKQQQRQRNGRRAACGFPRPAPGRPCPATADRG